MRDVNEAKIIPVHGESRTIFHVVDATAPEENQPAIHSSHRTRSAAKRAQRRILNRRARAPKFHPTSEVSSLCQGCGEWRSSKTIKPNRHGDELCHRCRMLS